MYLCVLNQAGELLLHQHMKAGPEPFLKALAPYRADRVVWVEGRFTWDWLADLCARQGLPFVLGHARSMKAIHGGTATNDTIASQKIAVWRRGGMRPQASVYPADMRATRDLRRRRMPLRRTRAALLAHLHTTNSQANRPDIGTKLAYKANRDGVADRFPAPAVQKRMQVDLALINHDDRLLTALELSIVQTAKEHDAQTFSRLRSIPGVGTILALVLLDEIQAIRRFPRGQEVVSYGRLVKGAQESAGKRSGTSGKKRGHAYRTWAFSEAAMLFLRNNPVGQQSRARLEKRPGKGKA